MTCHCGTTAFTRFIVTKAGSVVEGYCGYGHSWVIKSTEFHLMQDRPADLLGWERDREELLAKRRMAARLGGLARKRSLEARGLTMAAMARGAA